MKTNLSFNKLGLVMVLFFSTFIFSCTKEMPVDGPESDLTLKSVAIPQPDDMVCDLIAGQTINVGQVVYSHVGTNLLVEYVTTGGWILSEVHFYIGNMANFMATCMNKDAIQIGKFPYSASNLNGTTHSFSVPLPIPAPDGGYMVVAHAVVKKVADGLVVQKETAFAKCTYKPIILLKSEFEWTNNEGTLIKDFAFTDGDFNYPVGTACVRFGINYYVNPDEYMLQRLAWPDGVGKVNVSDDGEELTVVVTLSKEGAVLTKSYLFVGSQKDLDKLTFTCPDYARFPYLTPSIVTSTTHTFKIPIPMQNSISFNTLPSNRWGWYSIFNL
ncbi:MAG: hypothetical protein Q8R96_12485 [Bacteroidota bacterium]|nr:hypothetical protein [Bacteroidota bacterium]